jgi:hypothetical protein
MRAAVSLAANRRSLTFVFAGIIVAVAIYMLARNCSLGPIEPKLFYVEGNQSGNCYAETAGTIRVEYRSESWVPWTSRRRRAQRPG